MSADEMVTQAVAVLLDTDADDLTRTSPLDTVEGWDSVNALRLLTYLERQLGTQLDFERFHTARTIADLAAVVDAATSTPGAA